MTLFRHIAVPLHRAAQTGSPLLLQGPRNSGKTTLLRREFPGHTYVNLEDRRERQLARNDPERFLNRIRSAAIIDDIHRAPELVAFLNQARVNRHLILASSLRLTLAVATFELYPPTRAERQRRTLLPLSVLGNFVPASPEHNDVTSWKDKITWAEPGSAVDENVRSLVNVDDPGRFESFLDEVARVSGQVLDQQRLARNVGVSHRTIVRWLAVLDACFLTLLLKPFENSLGRRLVRRPKLHFLGSDKNFETEVLTELYCNTRHEGRVPAFFYWRDSNGLEIPLVIVREEGGPVVPVAIAARPNPRDEIRLLRWLELANVERGALITRADASSVRRSQRILSYSLSRI